MLAVDTAAQTNALHAHIPILSEAITPKNDQAHAFVTQFENRFCIFSPSVGQLYTNYTLFSPSPDKNELIIMPDPYAFHDTFNHLDPNAIAPTGIHIIPGELIGKRGVHIAMARRGNQRIAPVPFQEGVRQILKRSQSNDPFLPVFVKEDMNELNNDVPRIHLHRLHLTKLQGMATVEKQGIKNVITNKLMQLYRDCEKHEA